MPNCLTTLSVTGEVLFCFIARLKQAKGAIEKEVARSMRQRRLEFDCKTDGRENKSEYPKLEGNILKSVKRSC
ncbi:hypothetical protein EZV62_022658 [Acer yangbiense]|uniref:Uncharacterized protein n=1 Tax=Acer yangbiense TaxID=1000413 RepID=A0A5C7H9R1_9ROSI|nr:hypothetical protein EZV62_022658 [Acer yangbiense]